jgi:hypothetical protein
MARRIYTQCFLACMTFLCAPLMADMVCTSSNSCDALWQPFPTLTPHPQGSGAPGFAYWDGFSFDGANANIGNFINGTGFFAGDAASPRASLPYLGNPDGSAVNSFYFTSGGVPQVASLLEGNGLWASNDSLGWYDPNSSLWGWIFQSNGSPVVPTSVVFDPTATFGLFFVPNSSTFDPTKSYFTNDSLNGIADADRAYALANGITLGPETSQHFALFQDGSNGYYLGIKDRSLQISDGDYNDIIVHLNPVPEPGTLAMAGLLIAVPMWHLRRRRVSARK